MKVLFLVAMEYEIKNIFTLEDWDILTKKPYTIYQYKTNTDILLVATGIGKVNAAAATQFALTTYHPERIINLGTAGCINKEFAIGEVRQISQCRFFDVDVTAFGYVLGQIPQCDIVNYTLETHDTQIPQAKLISGDSFINDQTKLTDIITAFSPDLIDMELGAIAHTLYVNDRLVLLESYKAPSDYSDKSATKDFYENEQKAFHHLHILVTHMLQDLAE